MHIPPEIADVLIYEPKSSVPLLKADATKKQRKIYNKFIHELSMSGKPIKHKDGSIEINCY